MTDPKKFDIGQIAYEKESRPKTTFTPGPWHLKRQQFGEFSVCAMVPMEEVWVAGDVLEENADLIAAAPDLYAELENQAEMLRIYSTLGDTPETALIAATCASALVSVEAVLTKARGKKVRGNK